MPRLFLGNFEFEHTLAGGFAGALPRRLERLNDELAFSWLAVAADGDAIGCRGEVESTFLDSVAASGLPRVRRVHPATVTRTLLESLAPGESWELCPWGWTDAAQAQARRLGISALYPPLNVVRMANARRKSYSLEIASRTEPPGACVCSTRETLESVLATQRMSSRWVLKADFGMSGRERLLGSGARLPDRGEEWVRRRIERDGLVFFEPWLDRIDEAGIQIDVPQHEEPRLIGIAPLSTDTHGSWDGSVFHEDATFAANYAQAVEVAMRAAEHLRRFGYFGPLGIDAMRYRQPDGTIGVRPLQDVNARWTMGRLSLGLRRLLGPGDAGRWRHVRWSVGGTGDPRRWYEDFCSRLPAGSKVIRTAPFEIDGRPTRHGSLIIIERGGASAGG